MQRPGGERGHGLGGEREMSKTDPGVDPACFSLSTHAPQEERIKLGAEPRVGLHLGAPFSR